jgi:hypothetical protein
MKSTRPHLAVVGLTALVTAAYLIASAGPASAADPVTTTAEVASGNVSVTYSDTLVHPGDAVTASITITNPTCFSWLFTYAALLPDLFEIDSCTIEEPYVGTCGALTSVAYGVEIDNVAPGPYRRDRGAWCGGPTTASASRS